MFGRGVLLGDGLWLNIKVLESGSTGAHQSYPPPPTTKTPPPKKGLNKDHVTYSAGVIVKTRLMQKSKLVSLATFGSFVAKLGSQKTHWIACLALRFVICLWLCCLLWHLVFLALLNGCFYASVAVCMSNRSQHLCVAIPTPQSWAPSSPLRFFAAFPRMLTLSCWQTVILPGAVWGAKSLVFLLWVECTIRILADFRQNHLFSAGGKNTIFQNDCFDKPDPGLFAWVN